MKRMPNGMDGDSFYEKTAPSHTPDWVHRCTVLSEDAKEGMLSFVEKRPPVFKGR
jgi:bifunctional non-homologous end joining protein LigD